MAWSSVRQPNGRQVANRTLDFRSYFIGACRLGALKSIEEAGLAPGTSLEAWKVEGQEEGQF